MENKENNGFEFEDILSSSKTEESFEDIVSDTSYVKISGKHSYERKKRGLALALSKMRKRWKKLSKCKRRWIIALIAIVLVIAIAVGFVLSYFKYDYTPITSSPDELGFESIKDEKVINIALFGVDTKTSGSLVGNTDSIMILSINNKTHKIKIISLMRDTFVPILNGVEGKYGKLNSAYTYSPEVAIKTINSAFDLDISEYATINFNGMAEFVDAVGGIDVTLTEDEVAEKSGPTFNRLIKQQCRLLGISSKPYCIYKAGKHHLNGLQAVAYSRIRYCRSIWGTTDDYGRTDRQRYVMEQLFNEALKLKKTEYPSFIKKLLPYVKTSLSYSDILGIAPKALMGSPTFEQYRVPQIEHTIRFHYSGYGSVVYFDLDFAKKLINAIIYDDMTIEQYVEANGVQKNDWFASVAR